MTIKIYLRKKRYKKVGDIRVKNATFLFLETIF